MAGELLKMTVDELDRLISANTVMGDAIDVGDKTIIPVAGFGFGFGSGEGSGQGKGKEGEGGGQGAGAGAGAGVKPVAVIIIHKAVPGPEGVRVYSLKKGNLAEIISTLGEEVLPQIISAIKERQKPAEEGAAEGAETTIS
jgi:uncharacterized spore protein YtfJ